MIFYFHGFSSGANSQKANAIKSQLGAFSVFVPQYPSHQPSKAITYLEHFIKEKRENVSVDRIMLMGSSLGGFYAQYLAGIIENVCALVLINPCLEPEVTLASQVGEQVNTVTGETFYFGVDDLEDFSQFDVGPQNLFKPALVLLDEGDEIIDYRFAQQKYKGRGKVIVYPGGDHWFRHLNEAIPEIDLFYRSAVLGK